MVYSTISKDFKIQSTEYKKTDSKRRIRTPAHIISPLLTTMMHSIVEYYHQVWSERWHRLAFVSSQLRKGIEYEHIRLNEIIQSRYHAPPSPLLPPPLTCGDRPDRSLHFLIDISQYFFREICAI